MLTIFKKKEKEILYFQNLDLVKVDFHIPEQYQSQIKMMILTEDDIKRLYLLQPIVKNHTDELVKSFYDSIMQEASLMEIINQHSNVEKLGKTLYRHIIEIFSGKVNLDYVNQRKKIAHVHVRIGLGTKWYLNAFQHLMSSITDKLHEEISDVHELYQAIHSLQKIFSLEQQLVLESYELKEIEIRTELDKEKDEIRNTMQSSARELSAIAEETGASLEDLITQFVNVQKLTVDSQQAIEKVANLSEDGKNKMNQEKESANLIQEQVTSIHKEMEQLFELSKKIESVVDVVSSIANQINLLSLNATIESAHAGEHGKGFAVVANEIRNLSNLTKQSTTDIASLVKEISTQVKGVNETVEEFNQRIKDNGKITNETLAFFNEIVEAVQHSKEKTDVVFTEIKNSEIVVQQISEATTDITRTAESLGD